jgi:hypothetical protein
LMNSPVSMALPSSVIQRHHQMRSKRNVHRVYQDIFRREIDVGNQLLIEINTLACIFNRNGQGRRWMWFKIRNWIQWISDKSSWLKWNARSYDWYSNLNEESNPRQRLAPIGLSGIILREHSNSNSYSHSDS